jgi:uncharacterized protein YdcH (DUF465 family)
MTEQQKASLYGQLLNEHTRLHNKINEIKGQNIDLNQSQLSEIRKFESQQLQIMNQINVLMSGR